MGAVAALLPIRSTEGAPTALERVTGAVGLPPAVLLPIPYDTSSLTANDRPVGRPLQ